MALTDRGPSFEDLNDLWFTPKNDQHIRVLLITGENTAELRQNLKDAVRAGLLRNKQIALITNFDARETDALREMLLDSGASIVWTPENRIPSEAMEKLRDYPTRLDERSTPNPPKAFADYIDRALELWNRDRPDQ